MAEYFMPPNTPCPSCGQSHMFKDAIDNVGKVVPIPDRDVGEALTFRVRCPTTSAVVEVTLPAEPVDPKASAETGITCTTCLKSTYAVVGTRHTGTMVVQTLRCQNQGCEYEFSRQALPPKVSVSR